MEGSTLLTAILLFLFAAVVTVPIARRPGIGAVLGYLIAGIAIGPGIGLHSRRRRDPALLRAGRGVPDVHHRSGAEPQQAVGAAAFDLRRRRRPC